MPREPESRPWWSRLLHEQIFWQVVIMLVLLLVLIIIGPWLGLHLTSADLP